MRRIREALLGFVCVRAVGWMVVRFVLSCSLFSGALWCWRGEKEREGKSHGKTKEREKRAGEGERHIHSPETQGGDDAQRLCGVSGPRREGGNRRGGRISGFRH
jgi:hypothetical protein